MPKAGLEPAIFAYRIGKIQVQRISHYATQAGLLNREGNVVDDCLALELRVMPGPGTLAVGRKGVRGRMISGWLLSAYGGELGQGDGKLREEDDLAAGEKKRGRGHRSWKFLSRLGQLLDKQRF